MSEPRPLAIKHPLRVQLLAALSSGDPVELRRFAADADVPVSMAEYHADVLASADALTLADGTATITATGLELHRLAGIPERRREDRRGSDRRAP